MRLIDLVLSWLRVRVRPKPTPRRFPQAECPVCYRWVATSAMSPTRHRCRVGPQPPEDPTVFNESCVVVK